METRVEVELALLTTETNQSESGVIDDVVDLRLQRTRTQHDHDRVRETESDKSYVDRLAQEALSPRLVLVLSHDHSLRPGSHLMSPLTTLVGTLESVLALAIRTLLVMSHPALIA